MLLSCVDGMVLAPFLLQQIFNYNHTRQHKAKLLRKFMSYFFIVYKEVVSRSTIGYWLSAIDFTTIIATNSLSLVFPFCIVIYVTVEVIDFVPICNTSFWILARNINVYEHFCHCIVDFSRFYIIDPYVKGFSIFLSTPDTLGNVYSNIKWNEDKVNNKERTFFEF